MVPGASLEGLLLPLRHLPAELARLVLWLCLVMVIFVPLERHFPQRRQRIFRKDFVADLGFYVLNGLLPKLLLALPLSALAWLFHAFAQWPYYLAVAAMPIELRLLLALVVGDCGAYWGHRLSHQWPVLWHWHRVHHAAEAMDWLVNTRAHPIDLCVTRLSGLVPLYLLGLAQPSASEADMVPILYTFFATVWSFFVHANLGWRLGPLEHLVATPAFHHWHHSDQWIGPTTRNYAAIFPWIDRLFGSLWLPPSRWPYAYGISRKSEATVFTTDPQSRK